MGGHRWVLGSFLFALVGCAGAAAPAPAPERAEPAATHEPAPDDTAEPEAAPAATPTASLPDPLPEIGTLPTAGHEERGPHGYARVHYDLVRHPDEGVRAQLSALVTSIAEEIARRGDGGCRVRLAHARLVVFRCEVRTLDRGGYDTEAFALVLAIHEGGLRPVHRSELVRQDLMTQLRARCLERARRLDAAHEYAGWLQQYAGYIDPCGDERVALSPTPDGIEAYYIKPYFAVSDRWPTSITVRVPWDEARPHVIADGPLGPVFGLEERPRQEVAATSAAAWAVSRFGTETELTALWAALPEELRHDVELHRWRGPIARLIVRARPPAELTTALGMEATPIRLSTEEPPQPLRWARARLDLNVRELPHTEWGRLRGTLPRGALVVAIGGELEQRGSWSRVATALGHGHAAARFLVPLEGCVPPRPEGFDTTALSARVEVFHRRRRQDAGLFVRREGRRTRIEVHALSDACALGSRLLSVNVPGRAVDVRLTRTASSGGETLVVVGAPRGTEARYRAFRLGRRRAPVWEQTVEEANEHAVSLGEEVDGTWYPVSVGAQRLRWTGTALEP